jgi:hypothetical protein
MRNTMPKMKYAVLSAVLLVMTLGGRAVEVTQADPAKTIYGERNASAPRELGAFAFLIGK